MNIHTLTSESLLKEAARALNTELAALHSKNFLFLSSGGSSLALLDLIDASNFGPWSTIAVLDERYSTDPAINNFAQLAQTAFFEKTTRNGARFIDTRPQNGESIEDVAQRFENALKAWKTGSTGTLVATVGIGPDAHTSGIMPFPEDKGLFNAWFNDDTRWVKGYDAGNKSAYPLRITVTLPFLRKIDFSLSYIKGTDKKGALQKLTSDTGALHESPCRIIRELPCSEVFTDQRV